MAPSIVLATLAADPSRIAAVQPGDVPGLVGACAALHAALLLRLQAHEPIAPPQRNGSGPDRLLSADEAAGRLGVSRRWMYRHAPKLPFSRRLTPGGTLRFSEKGMVRWQDSRQ